MWPRHARNSLLEQGARAQFHPWRNAALRVEAAPAACWHGAALALLGGSHAARAAAGDGTGSRPLREPSRVRTSGHHAGRVPGTRGSRPGGRRQQARATMPVMDSQKSNAVEARRLGNTRLCCPLQFLQNADGHHDRLQLRRNEFLIDSAWLRHHGEIEKLRAAWITACRCACPPRASIYSPMTVSQADPRVFPMLRRLVTF